ncbi:Na+/H+ antiporter NhaC family protein [Pseudalkalibacillus berkeleyi]|uniref:Sodium:proton antiporter n=1 Tax=Pseudalkalibacillus berkeleyi TaxID=1069813 RepID=A0ABS9H2E2_9BACL|nr:Na+/H+ antiporter NhaC family protein [Pseudalkalibacillus berkeleyi]MCF6138221.1 sodium:proton antiporter [Pseudalkalibacillus berkeleyi]
MQLETIHFSLKELISLIIITVSGLLMAVAFQFQLLIGFMPGFIFLIYQLLKKGISFKSIRLTGYKGIYRNREIIWLLSLIGILLPSWAIIGTVPNMVSFILSVINPEHFLVSSFLMTMVISMTLGTSVGSLSVIGLPLMGTAQALGVPLEWTAGALISGAFVGDRSSPLSSAFQLLATSLEIQTKKQFNAIMPTALLTICVSSFLFILLDRSLTLDAYKQPVISMGEMMSDWIVFLPVILLIAGVIVGVRIRYSFFISIGAAFAIVLIKGISVLKWGQVVLNGIDGIGGLMTMIPFIIFISVVGIYSEMLERYQIVQPYINKLLTNDHSLTVNSVQGVTLALFVSLISPNQSFPIILNGRMLLPHWTKHFNSKELARVVSDSTMVYAGLVPWSLLAVLCSTIVGVSVIHYVFFAFFLWLSPLITILYSIIREKRWSIAHEM